MPLRNIDVAILCGGNGSRVAHILGNTPKCLATINGKPFLEHLIGYLCRFDVRTIFLLAGYKAEKIQTWLDTYAAPDNLDLGIIIDKKLGAGIGASLRDAANRFQRSHSVMIINGDTLLSGDLGSLIKNQSPPKCYFVRGVPSGVVLTTRPMLSQGFFCGMAVEVFADFSFHDIGTPEGLAKAQQMFK